MDRPEGLLGAATTHSEAQLRLLLGTQAMWETDADGVVVADSPSWRAYTGQTEEEWLGYGWLDAIHPDDRSYAEQQWRDAVAARRAVDTEFRLRSPDSGWRWTNVRAAPVLDGQGRIGKWLGLNVDIDARKRAEAARRESEERQTFLLVLSDALRAENNADAAANLAIRMVADQLNLDRCYLADYRLGDDRADITHQIGNDRVAPLPDTIVLSTFPKAFEVVFDRTLVVDDVLSNEALSPIDQESISALGLRALMAPTLRRGPGRPLWAMVAVSALPRSWTPGEVALVEEAAERTWTAMERAKAETALRESEERQRFLLTLGDAMRAQSRADRIIEVAARLLGKRLDASRVLFAEFDEARGVADIFNGWFADGAQPFPATMRLEEYEGPILHDLRAGLTVRIDDAGRPPFERPDLQAIAEIGVKSLLSVPLIIGDRLVVNLSVHQHIARRWKDEEVALAQDVAERLWADLVRARTEASLRTSEERLRSFAEASSDVFWIIDADGQKLEYLSPAYEAIWGEPRDAVLADIGHWATRVHPDDRVGAGEAMQILRSGKRHAVEYRIVRPDGGVRYIQDTGFPIMADGRIVRLAGVAQDLTDRHRAERALADAEHRARTLMAGVPQLVWRAVDGGKWTWASPQWTAFTGQREADSHSHGWLDAVHPDDRDFIMAAWSRAAETVDLNVEHRLRDRDGSYRWFSTRAAPVRDDAGCIIEWLGTSTDINGLRELKARQDVLVAELQHRTRNLIGVVRSLIGRTIDGAASLEDFEARFGLRLAALSRVQGLLSHLSAGQRVTFDELLRSELTALGAIEGDGRGAKVLLDGPFDVQLRSTTVQTFALALHELATNAVKYGALSPSQPDGRLAVTWRVETVEGDGRPNLYVEWRESGVVMPHVGAPPHGSGYGRELIEKALPYQLSAKTTYEQSANGVRCTIIVPVPGAGKAEP